MSMDPGPNKRLFRFPAMKNNSSLSSPSPLKAVVFDLDGTLIDSAPDLHAALNILLNQQNRDSVTLHQVKMMIGDGVPKLVERGFAATGDIPDAGIMEQMVERYLEIYDKDATTLTTLYPGVTDALQRLQDQDIKLGVCTNKPYAPARQIANEFGLAGFFKTIVGGDTLPGIRKPDGRHLGAALEQLNVSRDHAVMVGDNANDVAVARNSGVPVIVMSYGYTRIPGAELGADIMIDGFDELDRALAELMA